MQKVRIIAGSLRGRNIAFPDIEGLRPTLGRVRETAFAWLDPYIIGSKCLDMFAGSGAMGFEAISRGASEVVMLEKHDKIAAAILANKQKFNVDNLTLLNADYEQVLEDLLQIGPFDIVFLDPPFINNIIPSILDWLDYNKLLKNNSLIICEWGLQFSPNFPKMYSTKKLKRAGKVNYALLVYEKLGE